MNYSPAKTVAYSRGGGGKRWYPCTRPDGIFTSGTGAYPRGLWPSLWLSPCFDLTASCIRYDAPGRLPALLSG